MITIFTHKQEQKWYDLGIRYMLYLMVIIVPLVFHPAFYSVFIAPKLFTLRILTIIMLLLQGCKLFVERQINYRKILLNLSLLLFFLTSVISTFFSINILTSVFGAEGRYMGIITVFNLLIITFFTANYLSREHIRKLITISFCISMVAGIYGLLQYFGVFDRYFSWDQDPASRVFGTASHSNHFAAYLGMHLVIGVCLFMIFKNIYYRAMLFLGSLLLLITLFLTASRGALLAAIITILAIITLVALVHRLLRIFHIFIFGIAALLIIAGGLAVSYSLHLPLFERTVSAVNFINAGNIPDRLSWWMSSLQMFLDKPLLGSGLSTFRDNYNAYRRLDYKTLAPGDMQDLITPEAAHNEFINVLATQGIIGFAAFVFMLIAAYRPLIRIFIAKKINDNFYLAVALAGAMTFYLLQLLFNFVELSNAAVFYVFIGATGVFSETENKKYLASINTVIVYIITAFILIISSLGIYFSFNEFAAEYYYQQAIKEGANGAMASAVSNYNKAVNLRPYEYAYNQAYGDYVMKKSDDPSLSNSTRKNLINLAIANYENASSLNSHQPVIYLHLGLAYLQFFKISTAMGVSVEKDILMKGLINLNQSVKMAVNNPLYPYQSAKILMIIDGTRFRDIIHQYLQKATSIRPGFRDTAILLNQY